MAGPQLLGRLDPRLERDQLITQSAQAAGKRRPRLEKLVDQVVPTGGTDRLMGPRVQQAHRAEVRDGHLVDGGDY